MQGSELLISILLTKACNLLAYDCILDVGICRRKKLGHDELSWNIALNNTFSSAERNEICRSIFAEV